MRVKTITCHDVYNLGASLQAYALALYLQEQGHEVEIINYKPYYLHHYELVGVRNPKFDKPVLRELYQIAKFPGRLKAQFDPRKKAFDSFTQKYLPITSDTYCSNDELKKDPPEADVYIAGSDQIWNPLFQNGKDPAFFLDFVPEGKKKTSYAASFAVDKLETDDLQRMSRWLKSFDTISVRERSGVALVAEMGLRAVQVCDPVFLLEKEQWMKFVGSAKRKPYCFVYDFDGNDNLWALARQIAEQRNLRLVSAFDNRAADEVCSAIGPLEFVDMIYHADVVISNSFHATAFSVIFQKDFYVANRQEAINTRMRDLLSDFGIGDRLVHDELNVIRIDWSPVNQKLEAIRNRSKAYLEGCMT